MKSMKMIIMASTFPRWDKDAVPAFVKEQADFFAKTYKDMKIHILAPHDIGALKYEESEDYCITRFQYMWPAKCQKLVYPAIMPNLKKNKLLYMQIPILLISEFAALMRLIRKVKPDCIYAHWFLPQGIVAGLASLFTGIPVYLTSHSSDVMIMKKVPLAGPALVRFFIKRMKAITVVSKRSYEKIHVFFKPDQWNKVKDKIKIIPMGVNYNEFNASLTDRDALRNEYGLYDKTVLFFIGRLAEKKGVKYLLEAYAELTRKYSNLHLIIAGDGPLRESLETLAAEMKLDGCVTFAGYTTGQRKYDYFQVSDIVLVPSIITDDGDAEGLPVSLMEGLAFRKLCIATTVSGADDILEDKINGFLIREKESADIVSAVSDIINMSESDKEKVRNSAGDTAVRFDWNNIIKEHYDFFFTGQY